MDLKILSLLQSAFCIFSILYWELSREFAFTLSIQSQIYQKMNGKGFDQVNFDEISLTMHRIPG